MSTLPFPLVSPCCHSPLEITSLSEIAVVELFPGDEWGGPSYGLNSRCCQDTFGDPADVLRGPQHLENERETVKQASIQAASDHLKAKHANEWDLFREETEWFLAAVSPAPEDDGTEDPIYRAGYSYACGVHD